MPSLSTVAIKELENDGYEITDSAKFHQYYGDLCEREEAIKKERHDLVRTRKKHKIPLSEFIIPISQKKIDW